MVVTRGEVGCGQDEREKEVKYTVTEGDQTLCG